MFARLNKKINEYRETLRYGLLGILASVIVLAASNRGQINLATWEFLLTLAFLIVSTLRVSEHFFSGKHIDSAYLKKNHRYTTIFFHIHRGNDEEEITEDQEDDIEFYALVNDGRKNIPVKFKDFAPPPAFIISSDGKIESVLDMREVFTEG